MTDKPLVVIALVVLLAVGAAGPATAHETQEVEGYEMTFGGADEPLITGERMWLELEVVDAETGEPVANQADTLDVSVQTSGADKQSLEVSEKHGEAGVYEAPVVFTEPGEYVAHAEGSLEGTDVHTHFETTVDDRTELEYPTNESDENAATDETATASDSGDDTAAENGTDDGADESGFGLGAPAAALAVVAIGGAIASHRRVRE